MMRHETSSVCSLLLARCGLLLAASLSSLFYPTNKKKTKGKGNEENKGQKANNIRVLELVALKIKFQFQFQFLILKFETPRV